MDARLALVADRVVAELLAEILERLSNVEYALSEVIIEEAAASEPHDGPDALAEALNSALASVLIAGGFGTFGAIRAASDAELMALPGVNAKALKLIRTRVG